MITSIFLLFVAAGIVLASTVYGFGGLFPLMVAISLVAVFVQAAARKRQKAEPQTA